MKRIISIFIFTLILSNITYAQGYSSLWKQVDIAMEKDFPKTQIKKLEEIAIKAKKEKSYGNLLAAELFLTGTKIKLSPDSLEKELARIKFFALQAEKSDKVLAAIYYCAIGKIEQNNITRSDEDNKALAKVYFDKAMAYKDLLGREKLDYFIPFIKKGADDNIFNNDLLHVVGFEAEAYHELEKYYLAHNNRSAACYAAFKALEKDEDIVEDVDSLLTKYGDLDVAGELAKVKYENFSNETTDKERFDFVQNALKKYASWKGINYFRAVLHNLQSSKIETNDIPINTYTRPYGQYVKISLRNVCDLRIDIIKTTLTGETYNTDIDKKDMEYYAKKIVPKSAITIKRQYIVLRPAYENFEDSVLFPKLSPGVYIVRISSPSAKISAKEELLYVSNLVLLAEKQANNKYRYVVVDAVSGQPVEGAKIKLFGDVYEKRSTPKITLLTDKKGEAFYITNKKAACGYTYVSTATDKGFCKAWVLPSFYYSKSNYAGNKYLLMTDRAIYCPGQIVHTSIVAYSDSLEGLKRKVISNHKFSLSLRDANYREIGKKEVITDEFGTAATDFILPVKGLTGCFYISVDGNRTYETTIRVEEYKRPTFKVGFEDYEEKYAPGDTITLKGYARTYAGVSLQGAKVSYKVLRKKAIWWYWGNSDNEAQVLSRGKVTTDTNGCFEVKVPFILPKNVMDKIVRGMRVDANYYTFEVRATVTDQAGESQEVEQSLPISTKATVFTCDIPKQVVDTYALSFKLNYLNAAGKRVESMAKYIIIPRGSKKQKSGYVGNYITVKTNETVRVKGLSSGIYRLHAICGADTLNKDFVVFSLKDKRPVEDTHDWFYVSDSSFPQDGSPVYVQVGSTDKDVHVIYSIFAGNKLIEQGYFDQSNANNTRAFTYKPEYENGLFLHYIWVKDAKVYEHSVTIMRPIPDKTLTLKWKTFRNKLTPGHKEEWTLSVTRLDGTPANAQLMATLYDKSLEQILDNSWHKLPKISLTMPYVNWFSSDYNTSYIIANKRVATINVPKISLAAFNQKYLSAFERSYPDIFMCEKLSLESVYDEVAPVGRSRGTVKFTLPVIKEDKEMKGFTDTNVAKKDSNGKVSVLLRKNLNETTFFYPQLVTDKNGNVSIHFTLPESLTTWRFMGFAHDKEMNNGLLTDEVVVSKSLMIQPNLPRFLRVGDKAIISARIVKRVDKALQTKAVLSLIDPVTGQDIYTASRQVSIKADNTTSVSFEINDYAIERFSKKKLADYTLLIVRITVEADGFSDGEQQYLSVLPNKEYVINTYPITMIGKNIEQIELDKLYPKNKLSDAKLTIEYTNNPSWLMIEALPYMSKVYSDDAISLMTAYYVNALGKHIIMQSPKIKQTIDLWKQEIDKEKALTSNLEKNETLKKLVLSETPWVLNAEKESEQKQMLVKFFDENALQHKQQSYIAQLYKLQNKDGSFSWFAGMKGSLYMTVYIVKELIRLQILMGEEAFTNQETALLLKNAFAYLDREVGKEVKEMQRTDKKDHELFFISDDLCDYIYASALAKRPITSNITYLLNRLSKKSTNLTVYGKANIAIIFSMYGRIQKANEYLQSIKEYTVYTKDMGRYFDIKNAYYSWRNYKIPTEVAAIEALKRLSPNDSYIKEMQRWLLQEKRTQMWNTPINTINAIWAFMSKGKWNTEDNVSAIFKLDGKVLNKPKEIAGKGYVKVTVPISSCPKSLRIEKQNKGISFGGVYAQFSQEVVDIKERSMGMTIQREILDEHNNILQTKSLKVGDKIRVRLTITASRDFDFVQIIDKRAACLAAINQLSSYYGMCYVTPNNNSTNYYFNKLTKGKHIVETDYYIDRKGSYNTGICTIQSAYSPEYCGNSPIIKFDINR